MSKKKIAVVNVFFPPQAVGGATRVLADNIDVLQRDHADQYELVAFTTDANERSPHALDVYVHNGIRVYQAGATFRPNMDWHPQDAAMGDLFSQFLAFEQPDLVHFHCIQRLGGNIVEVTRDMGIPYVVTVHDAWWISDHQFLVDAKGTVYPQGHPDPFAPLELPDGVDLSASLERRSYLKGLLNDAFRTLIVSESFASIYQKNGIANVAVTRNGIMPRTWLPRLPSPSGRLRLAHIGGMSEHKGYHLFKQALSRGQFHNLEVLVVDHSQSHGYEHKEKWGDVPVTFVGKYSQHNIDALYARMDVLVAPSIWPESFGLVTREASAAGVWVIASNIGGIGEDVIPGVNGVCVAPSEAELFRVFSELNADPKRAVCKPAAPSIRLVADQVSELVGHYECALAERALQLAADAASRPALLHRGGPSAARRA